MLWNIKLDGKVIFIVRGIIGLIYIFKFMMYVLVGLCNIMKCLWMIIFFYVCLIGLMLYIIKEEDVFGL